MVHLALLLTLSITSSVDDARDSVEYGNPRMKLVEIAGELPIVAPWPQNLPGIRQFNPAHTTESERIEFCRRQDLGMLVPWPTDVEIADRLWTLEEAYPKLAQAVLDAKLSEQRAMYDRALENKASGFWRGVLYGVAAGVTASAALILTTR